MKDSNGSEVPSCKICYIWPRFVRRELRSWLGGNKGMWGNDVKVGKGQVLRKRGLKTRKTD